MSDAARAPFLCTLLCPLPSGPLGLDEKPAYIRERSSEKGHRARFSIKVKVYRKGWHRGAFDYRTFLGDYDTWEDAVKDMPLQREKKEKETRSETRAPTATVPPRSTSKRKQIDWDINAALARRPAPSGQEVPRGAIVDMRSQRGAPRPDAAKKRKRAQLKRKKAVGSEECERRRSPRSGPRRSPRVGNVSE